MKLYEEAVFLFEIKQISVAKNIPITQKKAGKEAQRN